MSQGDHGQPPAPRMSPGRIVAAVVAVLTAVPTAVGASFVVLSLSTDGDVHGYVLIGGLMLLVPAGLVFCLVLPLAFAPGRRVRYSLTVVAVLALALVAYSISLRM